MQGPQDVKTVYDGTSPRGPTLCLNLPPAHCPRGQKLAGDLVLGDEQQQQEKEEEATHIPFSPCRFPGEAGLAGGELMPRSEYRLISGTDTLISVMRLCLS